MAQESTGPQAVPAPLCGIVMGSRSDLEIMSAARDVLAALEVPHEVRIVSAHRTPRWMVEYGETAERRGLEVIIAGAGGAAHLPGMLASLTLVPVLGVPIPSSALGNGLDALMSIVQMPGGIPVGTLAIGRAGAQNAGLLAAEILALSRPALREKLRRRRAEIEAEVLRTSEVGP